MSQGELDRLLRRASRRDARRVSLEDVLVFGRFGRYLWQRSWRFAITRGAQEVLHLGELYLLFLFASQRVFVAAAVTSIALRVAGSAWWGGLESLRSGVRERSRDGRYVAIGPWVRAWLAVVGPASALIAVAAAGFVVVPWLGGGVELGAAYLAARLCGLACELPARTFHAGAYALRRVYQPTVALLAPSIVRSLALLALWPAIGVWSVPPAALLASLASAALTSWFSRRTYLALGIWPLAGTQQRRRRPRIRWRDAGRFAAAAVANASTGIGHLWTFSLLGFAARDPTLWLSFFLYLVLAAPLLDSCLGWVRLFYPDLGRLEAEPARPFRRLLERRLVRWSPLAGTLVWLPTLLVAPLLPSERLVEIVLVTWVLFIARARFTVVQLVAFCNRQYAVLILLAALPGLGVAAAYLFPHAAQPIFWLVVASLCGVPLWPRGHEGAPRGVMPIPCLIAGAPRLAGRGSWSLSELRPGRLLRGPQELLQRSARRWGPIGVDREEVLLRWQPGGPRPHRELLHDLEGRRWTSAEGSAPQAILSWAMSWPLGNLPPARSLAAVIREFQVRFPGGHCVRAGEAAAPALRSQLTWRQRQRVLDEGLRHASGRPPGAFLPFDVSALIDDGQLAALFFVGRDTPPGPRRAWRRWLRQLAVANALAAARARAADASAQGGAVRSLTAFSQAWKLAAAADALSRK